MSYYFSPVLSFHFYFFIFNIIFIFEEHLVILKIAWLL